MGKRVWLTILIGGVILIALVGFTLFRLYTSPASKTGIAIANESDAQAIFVIESDFRDGRLSVSPGGVREFDVYQGFNVPSQFSISISDESGKMLFDGQLSPGLGCWSYFTWDGAQLEYEFTSICV
ncbi:MAG: hypothetical protein GTO63_25055 [Anaerolineae bacterium]|nr:hypothetical protein [Anaerolineae bacterium]NIN97996.1 hypothetical protein [Anaerolineae bacterium]